MSDWILKELPPGIGYYVNAALHFFPYSWIVLTLGCAFGNALDYTRRTGARRARFVFYLVSCTYLICAAQLFFCVVFVRFLATARRRAWGY